MPVTTQEQQNAATPGITSVTVISFHNQGRYDNGYYHTKVTTAAGEKIYIRSEELPSDIGILQNKTLSLKLVENEEFNTLPLFEVNKA